jgi:probable HAF family extracellular repeat protein
MKTILNSHGAARFLTFGFALAGVGILTAQSPVFTPIDYPQATATRAFGINARGQIVGNFTSGGHDHGFLLSGSSYAAVDIPGASATYVYGINGRRDTVGSYTADGVTHGFLVSGGNFTTIDFPGAASTEALGISAAGDIVGDYSVTSTTPCCAAGSHAFVWSGGKYTTIDFPGTGAVFTYANAIDPDGGIVGTYSDGKNHGFLLKAGNYTSLNYPSATTTFMNALGINPRGDVVGRYMDASGRHAYLLSGDQYTSMDIPGAVLTAATAIDPQGNILGQYHTADGNSHGFLLKTEGPRYSVTDLGLQGPTGGPFALLDNGLISGSAPVSSGAVHAVLWYNGLGPIDIGTPGLSGPNSIAYDINERAQVAGAAETPAANDADFCGFKAAGVSPGKVCLPFLWQNGAAAPLPTLGGNNGYATAINSRSDAAGLAETATRDTNPQCPGNQFKPVIWQAGAPRQLSTAGTDLHGQAFNDSDGFVYGMNDKGQTAGASGGCSPGASPNGTYLQPLHALLWESDGTVRDLGSLGGTGHGTGIWAVHINNQGDVAGTSDIKGDEFAHAFLWTKQAGMQDLGTLTGDQQSGGIWVNDAGDVVGVSISFDGGFNPRAFLFQKGATEMVDLNGRIPANSPFYLLFAVGIDSLGEIIATALDSTDNQVHSVLLTPIRGVGASDTAENYGRGVSRPMILPEAIRKTIAGRFGIRAR